MTPHRHAEPAAAFPRIRFSFRGLGPGILLTAALALTLAAGPAAASPAIVGSASSDPATEE